MTDLPFATTVNPRRLLAGLADRISSGSLMLIGLAGLGFAGHMLVASNYGYFRDELYYIAAGHHLALGYVDFPLLMAFLAWGLGLLAGDSLLTLHVIPALASSLLILVTGLTARELGGSKLAQALAASASLVCLTFLATGSIFSMDSLDELWWTLIAYLLVRLLRRSTPRLWLLIGAVAGLGMLTKVTILFFLAALALGLLATPARAEFKTRWPWLALGIAGAGLAPYLVWEFQNGWPTLTYWHNYLGTLVSLSPLSFVGQQVYVMNPLTLPLWLGGEIWLLRGRCRAPASGAGTCLRRALRVVQPHPLQVLLPGSGLPLSLRRRWGLAGAQAPPPGSALAGHSLSRPDGTERGPAGPHRHAHPAPGDLRQRLRLSRY